MNPLGKTSDKMPVLRQHYFGIWFLALLRFSCATFAAEPSRQEVDPAIVRSFTRVIQPLILNRCAAGACHGGVHGAEPNLLRPPFQGQANQRTTLTNLHRITASVQGKSSDRTFLSKILNHHGKKKKQSVTKDLLTAQEQELFTTWLTLFHQTQHTRSRQVIPLPQSQGLKQASFEQPQQRQAVTHQQNRFKVLLEQAKNPPQFPPPRATPGLRLDEMLPDDLSIEQTPNVKDDRTPLDK